MLPRWTGAGEMTFRGCRRADLPFRLRTAWRKCRNDRAANFLITWPFGVESQWGLRMIQHQVTSRSGRCCRRGRSYKDRSSTRGLRDQLAVAVIEDANLGCWPFGRSRRNRMAADAKTLLASSFCQAQRRHPSRECPDCPGRRCGNPKSSANHNADVAHERFDGRRTAPEIVVDRLGVGCSPLTLPICCESCSTGRRDIDLAELAG